MRALKLDKGIELTIAIIGAVQSLYMTFYSFFEKKRNFKNVLLGLFFFSITLRIVKSVLWVYLETTPNWFLNLGFVAHSAFGPLLFLYVYYYAFKEKWSSRNLFHFIPTAFLLVFLFELFVDNFWYLGGYEALLYHQMLYATLSVGVLGYSFYKRKTYKLKNKEWLWLTILVFGTLLLQIAYFSNYVLGLTPYLLGPIVYGVLVYSISFFIVKNPKLLQEGKKYENIKLSSAESENYAQKIDLAIRDNKLYLNPNLTIKQLAKSTKLPVYLISHTINSSFSKNFPDYINTYRIDTAKGLLVSREYGNIKIASIAYESGFNSLSSFNIAFKKQTGKTPSSYRKEMVDL